MFQFILASIVFVALLPLVQAGEPNSTEKIDLLAGAKSISMEKGKSYEFKCSSREPVKVVCAVKTGGELKLEVGGTRLLFNAKGQGRDLQLVGGPWKQEPVKGAGFLERNAWHDIIVEIRLDSMLLTVDGKPVHKFEKRHDHPASCDELAIRASTAPVEINSFTLEPLKAEKTAK